MAPDRAPLVVSWRTLALDQRIWWLLGVGATVLWGLGLGREPLWLDEVYTYAMSQHAPREIVALTAEDVHPPLYYLLAKLSFSLLGGTDAGLRAPSVLGVVGLVLLGGGPIRRLFGQRTALIYAALILSSPGATAFAQEARMYGLAALAVTASALYGFLAVTRHRHTDFVAFGLASVGAAYLNNYGLLAVAACAASLLTFSLLRHRESSWRLMAVLGACALAYAPWFGVLLQQTRDVAEGFWVPELDGRRLLIAIASPFTYKFVELGAPWQAPVALLVAVLAASWGLRALFRRARQGAAAAADSNGSTSVQRAAVLHLLVIYVLTLAVATAYSLTIKPVLMPRYLIVLLGVQLLLVARGLAELSAAGPLERAASALLLGALLLLDSSVSFRVLTSTFNGPYRELAARIGPEANAVVVHTDVQTVLPSWRLLPRARHMLLFPPDQEPWHPGAGICEGAVNATRLNGTNDLPALLALAQSGDGQADGPLPVWIVDAASAPLHLSGESNALLREGQGWQRTRGPEQVMLSMSWVQVSLSRWNFTGTTEQR